MIKINTKTKKIKVLGNTYDYTAFSINTTQIYIYHKGKKNILDYETYGDVYMNGKLMTSEGVMIGKYFQKKYYITK